MKGFRVYGLGEYMKGFADYIGERVSRISFFQAYWGFLFFLSQDVCWQVRKNKHAHKYTQE